MKEYVVYVLVRPVRPKPQQCGGWAARQQRLDNWVIDVGCNPQPAM
jgi:hypothetical protein